MQKGKCHEKFEKESSQADLAHSRISVYGNRSGGSRAPGTSDHAVPAAGVLLPGKRIRAVSQMVYRYETLHTPSGQLRKEPCHDAENKVQPSDPGLMYAASGVSCHAEYIRQDFYSVSYPFQV